MLQDLIRIKPQTQRTYHAKWYELATPVRHPRAKAHHYFQWALIHHAKNNPAEAYKYYERAIMHHKHPLYLRQMALLHHEMGYFRDALKYMRTAFDLEQEAFRKKQQTTTSTRNVSMVYSSDDTYIPGIYAQDQTVAASKIHQY